MSIAPTHRFEIEQVILHIGRDKALELVRLAGLTSPASLTGNSQQALDALRALVGGSNRPAGVFPVLEAAIAGVPPGRRELDLQRTLDLLKAYFDEAGGK